jgi:cell wall assembly regulator SMI1
MEDEVERVLRGWERLERWLRRNAGPLAESLRPGVTDAELAAVEARLGLALPDEVRAFYRVHDGAGFVLAFVEDELLSLDDAARTRASMNDLGWGRPGGPPNEGRAVGPVKPLWWSRDWLPFVGRSWMLCVDLDPPPGGRRGQIVSYAKDDQEREVVHSSIGAWLEHWADRLEAGLFAFDEEEEALFATSASVSP